ncbi:MAG: DsbA family protein [Bacteroidetes bacterium]|nr:MAG: DsbA family protein [Bacteroidota bacterium]
MNKETNPLLCDPETGVCEMPQRPEKDTLAAAVSQVKPVKLSYFTDPICSSCWGIEVQLRKLKLEYGNYFEIDYHMGGLLPDWSYNSGGISKPSDVAHHWDEVSAYYDMPIDGDVWLEDPLHSSYPPSIAFKAAQLQSEDKALDFMRIIREMVFLQKKNITKWEHLADAAAQVGLDSTQLKSDYEGRAKALFEADLNLSRNSGVRGFPSIFFSDTSGNKELVYGARPYATFEAALLKAYPQAKKQTYANDWESLFNAFASLTAREFSELSGQPRKQAEAFLTKLTTEGKLEVLKTKNGSLWKKR